MKKCPFCAEEIQDEAIVCRFCGRDINRDPISPTITQNVAESKKGGSYAKILLFSIIIISLLVIILLLSRERDKSQANEKGAFYICQDFVEESLKAPASAKFASWSNSKSVKVYENQFQVTSYVDSENSFGAMVRTPYVCTVNTLGGTRWSLVDLVFE